MDAPATNPTVSAGEAGSCGPALDDAAGLTTRVSGPAKTGSDVGSLYPFIQGQAIHGEFRIGAIGGMLRRLAPDRSRTQAPSMYRDNEAA